MDKEWTRSGEGVEVKKSKLRTCVILPSCSACVHASTTGQSITKRRHDPAIRCAVWEESDWHTVFSSISFDQARLQNINGPTTITLISPSSPSYNAGATPSSAVQLACIHMLIAHAFTAAVAAKTNM